VKKLIATALIALGITGVVLAEEKKKTENKKTENKAVSSQAKGGDPVIVKYGQGEIRQSELEAAIKTLPDQYQGYVTGPGKRAFAEDYLRMKMLAAQAEKNGLDKSPEVQAQLRLMRANTLAAAQLEKLQESIKLTDAELQKSYDSKKSEYESASARHILIAFKGSPALPPGKKELTEDEAKAKAEDLRKKIVGGADFAELAKKESDDSTSGTRGGDLGTFNRGQMVPEFEKAAFETKIGEISPVIRTQFGYHILQVKERKSSPLSEVKTALEQELKQKKVQEALDQMKTGSNATFNEAYFTPPPAPPVAAPAAQAPAASPVIPAPAPKPKS